MKTLSLFLDQINRATNRQQDKTTLSVKKSVRTNRNLTVVNPMQISDYLGQHNFSVGQFINDQHFQERVIGQNDLLDVCFLRRGEEVARSVCRIHIHSDTGPAGFGTGFLIAPQILITNHHILPTNESAQHSSAEFNYEEEEASIAQVSLYPFNAEKLFYTNEALDFTIVWVDDTAIEGTVPLQQFGFLPLIAEQGKIREGEAVSIIQHADGAPKQVSLRENRLADLSLPQFLRYITDKKSGSSGAPVFNDHWEVVALHHTGIPRYNKNGQILNRSGNVWDYAEGELQIDWLENEGVRISSIIYDITTNANKRFPLLSRFFTPITDSSLIAREIGEASTETAEELYYPQLADEEDKKKYYQDIGGIDQADYANLQQLLESSHSRPVSYQPAKYVYPTVDLHPDGLLRSIYSGKTFTVEELRLADEGVDIARKLRLMEWSKNVQTTSREDYRRELKAIEEALPYNCEHVVCQSWFDAREPMRGDLHHLFACESRCNSFRNNHPYDDFEEYKPRPTWSVEKEMLTCGYTENDRFEPENNKGIVARATLYFLLRYPNAISVYRKKGIVLLKRWAKEQAVTQYEKHRNREIFLLQGNRNPFVDFPELVDQIDFQVSNERRAVLSGFPKKTKAASEVANDVKRAILMRYGYPDPDPSSIEDTKLMADFEFSNNQYLMLTAVFNDIARKYHTKPRKIMVSEVLACGVVKDCIDLVNTAIP
ncbi:endonuclease [Olivibacter sp. CPCC 100613]|uniref:endonuclease n=1 Tax=Olivibacter sp. CPCC 100613 TaxID=3079931 RepID=UPI002FF5B01D